MNLTKLNACFLTAACAMFLMVANAGAQTAVPLGTASAYGVLAGSGVTNTGATTINGDLGLSPTAALTGAPLVTGATNVNNAAAILAKADLRAAYLNAQGQAGAHLIVGGALGGLILKPGLYKDDGAPASLGITGTLTLDFQGDPNAVFVFQSASTLIAEVGSSVVLINNAGGAGCNVYWQVGSAATLKTSASFVGTILAYDNISLQASATVAGRLLAGGQAANGAGAVTLINNAIAVPVCAVVPATGSIAVVKNRVGGVDGAFAFTSNFGFASLTTIAGTASQTVAGLTAGGAYNVSETVPAGWTLAPPSCDHGTPFAIVVVAGATTTCTFTNTAVAPPLTGSITIVKNTVGGNGTFAFASNFGLASLTTIAGTATQTFVGLAPGGAYSVIETVPAGWTETATCTSGTLGAIVVAAGATTTCVITNTHGAPPVGAITVVKNTVGGDGTFSFTSTFGLTYLTTNGGTATQTFSGLATGSYGLSETAQSGWTQTGGSCTNGTLAIFTVNAGETTTCTITNTTAEPDLIIAKSHAGDFHQGDIGDVYTLTVTNVGQRPTTGVVTVTDTLPAGLTATAIAGTGWTCTVAPLTCTRNDALAAAGVYPVITITVNVANNGMVFGSPAGPSAFQTGDIMLSMSNGGVQWRRHDFTLVKVLTSAHGFFDTPDAGQAKGMAFDSSGNFYVTHWYGTQLLGGGDYGNDVVWFDRYGNGSTYFGSGYSCNPTSILFDASGNAYVGHADCSTQVLKFDSSGNPLAQYSLAVENRGTEHIVLDPNQCTMYYTSEGGDVKQFNVCSNTQMPNFNTAPLPDAAEGGQQFALLPGGGMLVADFSVIAMLGPSGNLVTTYGISPGHCWLGMALDPDGTSFWASDWCSSVITRFDMATGSVIETHLADDQGFTIKQICIPKNTFNTNVTNTATVSGGGELNTSNDTASDVTNIDLPAPSTPAVGVVNAAGYTPTVAAGSIASVFGSGLSTGQAIAAATPLPTTLASSSFQIGGLTAPLLSVSPNRVNLQVPWELAGQSQATVTGTVGGTNSSPQTMSIAPAGTVGGVTPSQQTMTIARFAPGCFTINQAGSSMAPFAPALFAPVTNPSQVLASPSGGGGTPLAPGALISIYCTGLGAVSNQPATGVAAQANPLSVTTTTPTVTIGGIAAPVISSVLEPGAVGLYQVTVQVPAAVPAGAAVPLTLSIGGVASNDVTICIGIICCTGSGWFCGL